MRINNRLFPYPVLNNDKSISDYSEDTYFELVFDDKEGMQSENFLKFNNIYIRSNDEFLNGLARDGRVNGLLIIECSNSIFRKKYHITFEPQDIEIPMDNFSGEVQISAFIYATEDIDEYVSPNFSTDYSGYRFKVEQYCILAVDDTLHVDVDNQPDLDNKHTSIFNIVCDKDHYDDVMRCQSNNYTGKIVIILPEKYYRDYMIMKTSTGILNASFATIAIPVLTEQIMLIQNAIKEAELDGNEYTTMEDIYTDYRWFRAVAKAFKRVKNRDLTIDYLKNEMHPIELSQIILNYSTCNGIDELSNLVISKNMEEEDAIDE